MKLCSKCKTPKPAAHFRKDPRYSRGRFCWCQTCVHNYQTSPANRSRARKRRRVKFLDPKVREARRARVRELYATPRGKRQHKDRHYRKAYGITLEFFESEVKKQNRRCRLCNQVRKLVADHNHKTKKYRGAICGMCNVAVGRIEAVPDFISKVQEYIQ